MFTLKPLPYGYDSLEPFIDKETMHYHHDKHHATYVKNLNDLISGEVDLADIKLNNLLQNLEKVPEKIRTKVKNNAGGVANHDFFWEILCPPHKSKFPKSGKLSVFIKENFGSFESFKEKFSAAALGQFGSGWAWLTVNIDKDNYKKTEIVTTANQNTPVSDFKFPILCIDVWEHAYYLKYKNLRIDYINAWWNLVNWDNVEKNLKNSEVVSGRGF